MYAGAGAIAGSDFDEARGAGCPGSHDFGGREGARDHHYVFLGRQLNDLGDEDVTRQKVCAGVERAASTVNTLPAPTMIPAA